MVLEDSLRYLDEKVLSAKKIMDGLLYENIDVDNEKWWKKMNLASDELEKAHINIQESLKLLE